MKKVIYTFVLVVLGCSVVCGQKRITRQPAIGKSDVQKKNAATISAPGEREKFNPQANPNDDLQAAIVRAQKENKRIVLDVGGEWCIWCVKMDNYFLENKALAKLRDESFVWIKVNLSPENENKEFLAKFPPAAGYPHLFVLETDGSLLHSQSTAELEEPNLPIAVAQGNSGREVAEKKAKQRSYDLFKFVEFLKLWSSQ